MDEKTSPIELQMWRDEVLKQLEKSREDLAALQKSIKESEERLQLLDRLIALDGDYKTSAHESSLDSDPFLSSCIEVIREYSKPMSIGDLHSNLLERGFPIPGKGTQANVIARIQRSEGKIIRTGRGMYGLPEFGIPEVRPVRSKRVSSSGTKK